jgi:Secretion system C-terminal sorting domain
MSKKLLLFLAFALTSFMAIAQATFKLTETGYVGALGTTVANDWTTGWTNFNPKTTVYGEPTDTTMLNAMLTAGAKQGVKDITTTVTLDGTKIYLLKGIISVKSGGKLVIPEGTIIRGLAETNLTPNKNYASIVVERGGRIEITGTAAKPVIMTSAKAVNVRDRGDWGGLVICGNAKNNQLVGTTTTGVQLEGFNLVTFEPGLGFHGGTNDDDNSGIIRYLRIEFPGLAFEANREINGLTLGSVGRGTEVRNVQISFSNDDSFEWFGGTVNSSNLIAWKGTDDDFDTDFGYSGLSQFGIGVKDTAYYDLSYNATMNASTSEGFESDNDANGSGQFPITNAIFSNYTMIGPVPIGKTYETDLTTVTKAAFRRGARIRRNSAQRVVNSIFMGYRNFVMIDGDSSLRNTNNAAALALLTAPNNTAVDVKTKQLQFNNNLIVNTAVALKPVSATANGLVEVATDTRLASMDAWVRQTGALANKIDPVAFTAGTLLVDPSAYSTAPNFRPIANSPALTGANFKDNPVLMNLFIVSSSKELKNLEKVAPIFPNPIKEGTVFFGKEVLSYGIFDMSGRLISNGFSTDRAEIKGLSKGMYFIKLDGKVQKLIVQ